VPITLGNDNSNNKKVVSSIKKFIRRNWKKQQKQAQVQDEQDFSHKGKNRHSKKII
jgi:hypothetical protein